MIQQNVEVPLDICIVPLMTAVSNRSDTLSQRTGWNITCFVNISREYPRPVGQTSVVIQMARREEIQI